MFGTMALVASSLSKGNALYVIGRNILKHPGFAFCNTRYFSCSIDVIGIQADNYKTNVVFKFLSGLGFF